MIQTAEQIFETIRVLPADEREKLERLLKGENANGTSAGARVYRNERWEKSQKWIHENKEKYDGEFVLLEGDELIGHGMDPKALYTLADERGIQRPFVKRVKAVEEPFFGGW